MNNTNPDITFHVAITSLPGHLVIANELSSYNIAFSPCFLPTYFAINPIGENKINPGIVNIRRITNNGRYKSNDNGVVDMCGGDNR